jgi:hypothetical protein
MNMNMTDQETHTMGQAIRPTDQVTHTMVQGTRMMNTTTKVITIAKPRLLCIVEETEEMDAMDVMDVMVEMDETLVVAVIKE